MGRRKQKLELTWIGKDERPKLEPRILLEDPGLSYHADKRVGDQDIFDNILIQGDNLLALKALEQDFAGQVKCIFIDPPYNTGSAFELYEDGLEHSIWLGLMRDRLEVLKNLLSQDGSIFVCTDFNEAHYLKVLMDEVFGRENFQREIIWRIGWLSGYKTNAKNFIRNHDTILYYVKSKHHAYFKKKYLEKSEFPPRFNDSNLRDLREDLLSKGLAPADAKAFLEFAQRIGLPNRYPLEDTWNCSVYDSLNSIAVMSYSGESVSKMLGVEDLKGQKAEALVRRVLECTTSPGDLVLDSFAGTGTTAAVAQKMRRRWIAVEIGDHAKTHIVPRLQRVIDGADKSGVTKVTGWQGGGGFRFYRLAPSLLEKDHYGQWVISRDYNAKMLSEAMCKQMGFFYAPSDTDYWNHGYSTEQSYIYVTGNRLTHDFLARLAHEVGKARSLLICCKAFEGEPDAFDNLMIARIPQAVLDQCEWGKDDYSLNVENLPMSKADQMEPRLPLDDAVEAGDA